MTWFPAVASRRVLVWFTAIVLAAGGAVTAASLPSGIYPEVEFPRVVVVARGGDATPALTQVALTRPIESALTTVLGVERIRSRTIRGAVELSLQFAPSTDMSRALQLVEARVGALRASLASGTDLTVERLTTTSFPVLTFNLTGTLDPRRMRELADLVIRPAFSRVRGVGRVEVLGGDVREVEVILDPDRLAALRVTPLQIAERIRASTGLQAVGRVEQAHALVAVIASAEPQGVDDLAQVPVSVGPDGSPILLSSVAQVVEGAEDRLLRVAGPGGETVLVSVSRLPGSSTPSVVNGVNGIAQELAPSLPSGVQLVAVYDQAALVQESIHAVRDAILIGIVLCIVVLGVFLRDWRAGLAAAVAVPLTLGISFLPMLATGQSLNLMSLGGLAVAIGLVIDDAIVVVEGIARHRAEGLPPLAAAQRASEGLLGPLIGTTVTTVIVVLPLAWLDGVVGRFFSALAVTLAASVLLSLVLSVTVVPLAAASWLDPHDAPATAGRLATLYGRFAERVLRHPIIGLVTIAVLLGVGVLGAIAVPSGFLPTMDEGAFVLDYFLPAGTSLTDTDAAARAIEKVLQANPDVETFSRRTGAELGPVAATEVNRGDIMVRLKAKRSHSAEDVIAVLRQEVAHEVPATRTEFVQVLQDVINDLAGAPRPIELKLFGDDYQVLRDTAQRIADRIHDVPGLVDLYPGFEGLAPELRFRLDRVALARAGKTPEELSLELDAVLRGNVVASIRRADRPIGVRVRYPDAVRFDPARIASLPVVVAGGVVSRVSALATPVETANETSLLRESLRPVVIITADHEHRDVVAIVSDIERKLRGFRLPPGYRIEYGGQYAGQRDTLKGLGAVMAFGLLAVLGVLLAQFHRARLAFVVLGLAPLSIVGALAALWATGTALNASSLMGCVLLVGLVAKNGILLLEAYEHAREAGQPTLAALIRAGRERVRPIVMTTLATLAGLAPLAFGIGAGADLQRPLAVAVIGGLVISTLVSLLVLPCIVLLVEPRSTSVPLRGTEP